MTILVLFHLSHCRDLKHFYLHEICIHLRHNFPQVVSYNRFVEVQSHVFSKFMFFLKRYALGPLYGITYVDSTMIPVCHNIRDMPIRSSKDLPGTVKERWDAAMVSNYILLVMTPEK